RQFSSGRLPPLRAVHVPNGELSGQAQGQQNVSEADAIIEQICECLQMPEYDGKTFGVISLTGKKQAKYIGEQLIERIGPDILQKRRLICGDSYTFQGDERDIIFLSMVTATRRSGRNDMLPRALTGKTYKQRFNVAVSRAKDQIWLFHSVSLDELRNPQDMRRLLLEHFTHQQATEEVEVPDIAEVRRRSERTGALENSQPDPFANWLEADLYVDLKERDFRVLPHMPTGVGDYSIDLVVDDGQQRVGIECEGEHWDGEEAFAIDFDRQQQLRRAGWKILRVRGSEYRYNPTQTVDRLCNDLAHFGNLDAANNTPPNEGNDSGISTDSPSMQVSAATPTEKPNDVNAASEFRRSQDNELRSTETIVQPPQISPSHDDLATTLLREQADRDSGKESTMSGRLGTTDEFVTCEISGTQVLADEVSTSEISGRVFRSDAEQVSAVSGTRGHRQEFEKCEFTDVLVLPEELISCALSGRLFRRDELVTSSLSGRMSHSTEGRQCEYTGRDLLSDEVAVSDLTGKTTARQNLMRSEISGRRGVPSEMITCLTSGRRVLRDEVTNSAVADEISSAPSATSRPSTPTPPISPGKALEDNPFISAASLKSPSTLREYTVKELGEIAKKVGVDNWRSLRKEQLVQTLVRHAKRREAAKLKKGSTSQATRPLTVDTDSLEQDVRSADSRAKYSVAAGENGMEVRLSFRLETGERTFVTSQKYPEIVEMVNRAMERTGQAPGGVFWVNEFGQVLIRTAGKGASYIVAGNCDRNLRFEFSGKLISPEPPRTLRPGQVWPGPIAGIPYALTADGTNIKSKNSNKAADRRLSEDVGSAAANRLAQRLSQLKPGGGRIYITEARYFFSPIHVDDKWQLIYLGGLENDKWFSLASVGTK
ncbi:MAG: AAA domain-containing protein, partial [Planctomycetaceae bacterium]